MLTQHGTEGVDGRVRTASSMTIAGIVALVTVAVQGGFHLPTAPAGWGGLAALSNFMDPTVALVQGACIGGAMQSDDYRSAIEGAGFFPASTEMVARVGERNRPVVLTLHAVTSASLEENGVRPAPPSRHSPWVLPLAAFGAAALGSFGSELP